MNERGKWVRNDEVHPFTNIYNRKWRVAHLDGSVTHGTYHAGWTPPPTASGLEWFFEEQPQ